MPKTTKTVFSFANHTPQCIASKPVPQILHSQILFGCSREIRFISRAIIISKKKKKEEPVVVFKHRDEVRKRYHISSEFNFNGAANRLEGF